jgi:hypothetical protein
MDTEPSAPPSSTGYPFPWLPDPVASPLPGQGDSPPVDGRGATAPVEVAPIVSVFFGNFPLTQDDHPLA